jgi:hypothetical protein
MKNTSNFSMNVIMYNYRTVYELKLIADAVGFKSRNTRYERRTTLKLIRFEKTVSLS